MKYLVVLALTLAASQASIIGGLPLVGPLGVGAVIKGASSSALSVGIDGVSATAVDGAVVVAPSGRVGLAPAAVGRTIIAGPSGTIVASNGVGLGLAPVLAPGLTVVRPAIASAVVSPGILGLGAHGIW